MLPDILMDSFYYFGDKIYMSVVRKLEKEE